MTRNSRVSAICELDEFTIRTLGSSKASEEFLTLERGGVLLRKAGILFPDRIYVCFLAFLIWYGVLQHPGRDATRYPFLDEKIDEIYDYLGLSTYCGQTSLSTFKSLVLSLCDGNLDPC